MAKLNSLFDTFLTNINPDDQAVEYAQEAHKPVRECLENQDEFKERVTGSFLYGSYKRYTAVGDIKDVDIVLLTDFDTEEDTPESVLRQLKAALASCYDDPENPQYQRRSIRIDDPLPDNPEVYMTLDIIPAVITTDKDGPLLVPDRDAQEWILTHPRGHLRHSTELNESADSKYVPLVKIMKWWWKYQCEERQPAVERPKPKGFWVECLTGEMHDPEQSAWADHFVAVLENIVEAYQDVVRVPELDDPGLEEETIKTSMTLEEFEVFMEAASDSLQQAKAAIDEEDKVESSQLWREIFGENFPLYDSEDSEESRTIAEGLKLASSEHAEPLPWRVSSQKRYKVRLDAYLYRESVRLGGINSNSRAISDGLKIKYIAKTRARDDYEVYWQVVNTGPHAAQEKGLRGGYFLAKTTSGKPSSNPRVNWETTQYTGKHWIECFIIKNGVCVGRSGRFYVNIRNPNYP
jgi:hypothetical protein